MLILFRDFPVFRSRLGDSQISNEEQGLDESPCDCDDDGDADDDDDEFHFDGNDGDPDEKGIETKIWQGEEDWNARLETLQRNRDLRQKVLDDARCADQRKPLTKPPKCSSCHMMSSNHVLNGMCSECYLTMNEIPCLVRSFQAISRVVWQCRGHSPSSSRAEFTLGTCCHLSA